MKKKVYQKPEIKTVLFRSSDEITCQSSYNVGCNPQRPPHHWDGKGHW